MGSVRAIAGTGVRVRLMKTLRDFAWVAAVTMVGFSIMMLLIVRDTAL